MKLFVVFLACLAVASAGFTDLRSASKPLISNAVREFTRGMQNAPALHEALKTKRSMELMQLERDVQTDLGQQLQEQLNNVMAQIQDAIDHGQLVAQSLIDKAKELFLQLQQAGGNVFQMAQQFLAILLESGQNLVSQILGGLGIGKRSLFPENFPHGNDLHSLFQLLNQLANSINLENITQQIIEHVTSIIGKNRDILSTLLGPLLDALLGSIDLTNIPIIGDLLGLLGKRDAVKDPRIWGNIMDTFGTIWESLSDKFNDFKEWMATLVQQGMDEAQSHILNVQQLAQQFVQDAQNLTQQTIEEAVDFFRPYQEDLGSLWNQLLDIKDHIIG